MFGLIILLLLGLWILVTIVATVIGARKKGSKGAFIGFMIALSLTACDTRTMEQVQADRIEECKAVIQTTLPDVSHLPLTERGQYIEEAERWDRCRYKIEDSFLPNEREENGWKNTSDYRYVKLGGKVIGGAKDYLGWGVHQPYFYVSYEWTQKYKYFDSNLKKEVFDSKQHTHFGFTMRSMRSLQTSDKLKQSAVPIDQACLQDETMLFIWQDIIFLPNSNLHKAETTLNLREQWKTLCPIAVEAVKNQLTVVSDTNIGKQP